MKATLTYDLNNEEDNQRYQIANKSTLVLKIVFDMEKWLQEKVNDSNDECWVVAHRKIKTMMTEVGVG